MLEGLPVNENAMTRFARAVRMSLSVATLIPILASTAVAQVTTGADGRSVTPRDTANAPAHRTLFTYRDAALAAGFVGLTFAMFPLDKQFAERLQNPTNQQNRFFERSATGVAFIASPGSYYIGTALYAIGRAGKFKDVADLGWHGTEAVLVASAFTNLLKGTLGRSRPYVSALEKPQDFDFIGGFGKNDRQSFPSGHTATAFAAASAVTGEARRMWPKSVWVVAPAMYGGATLVGLSRMYHNRHWASDVVLGAAVGTFSGLKVIRYSHAHPDNKLDKLLLGGAILPNADGGATLAFQMTLP